VVDPASRIDARLDVAVAGGRITVRTDSCLLKFNNWRISTVQGAPKERAFYHVEDVFDRFALDCIPGLGAGGCAPREHRGFARSVSKTPLQRLHSIIIGKDPDIAPKNNPMLAALWPTRPWLVSSHASRSEVTRSAPPRLPLCSARRRNGAQSP
jgi:hypothetical protein